jgi:multiple sugar transport system ATP-binding protein
MSDVVLNNITKSFPGIVALHDVSFEVMDGEFFVLLGPTGAGKTTTLRVIAGLEKQDNGTILFDSHPIDDLTPADRDVAFVFQQYSLYPTMTVYDNLAFPLRSPMRKVPKDEVDRRVGAVAETLRIHHLLQRRCSNLSGGEMQRVSIGRAIVREPRLFLMDEPLSNLDAKLRESLRVELQHLQRTQGSTTLFVTHDQIEALTMADRIGVLNEGKLVQVGKPDEIYDQPATTFVARLVGTPRINIFEAAPHDGRMVIKDSELHLAAPTSALPASFLVGIRPEDVNLDPQGTFSGRLILAEPLGVETILHIQNGRQTIVSLVAGMTDVRVGQTIRFSIAEDRLHLFYKDGLRLKAA